MSDHRHDIEKYIKGELTPAERYALERKALNDPFLADALEGAEQLKHEQFLSDVDALKKTIAGKNLPTEQAGTSGWMWPMRIAAGLAIIAVSSYIVWSVLDQEPPQDLALQKNETSNQPLVSADSTPTVTETLPSPSTEQSGAGPGQGEKDVTSRSTVPSKAEAKSQPTTVEPERKTEAEADVVAEEALETKRAESLAQSKPIEKEEEIAVAKTDDVQRAKKLSVTDDKKKEAAPAAADRREAGVSSSNISNNIIRGQVTSAEDGSPLPGVNVIIKGTTIGTATDAQGNYQIDAPNTNPSLVFSFIGLQSTEVNADDRKEVDVQLALDVAQLSEVVVTGYGTQTGESLPPTVDLAHPEIGNRAFKQYLEKNIRYPEPAKINRIEGRVTVEFTIEPNGSLTNFNVIRGIGSGCDEELIRLIKEGPKWIPTKKDNVPVQDKAKVRLKFELPK
jgi:TonB family protein